MDSNKGRGVAYSLAVVLFIIGVLSYAAFSANPPEEPICLMFSTTAGKVLFHHKTHTLSSGYGISCNDCHHHPEDDESALQPCGDCHQPTAVEEAIPQACMACHEADEIEDVEMAGRTDAFHSQCIDCHNDFEAGPVECSECHVM